MRLWNPIQTRANKHFLIFRKRNRISFEFYLLKNLMTFLCFFLSHRYICEAKCFEWAAVSVIYWGWKKSTKPPYRPMYIYIFEKKQSKTIVDIKVKSTLSACFFPNDFVSNHCPLVDQSALSSQLRLTRANSLCKHTSKTSRNWIHPKPLLHLHLASYEVRNANTIAWFFTRITTSVALGIFKNGYWQNALIMRLCIIV